MDEGTKEMILFNFNGLCDDDTSIISTNTATTTTTTTITYLQLLAITVILPGFCRITICSRVQRGSRWVTDFLVSRCFIADVDSVLGSVYRMGLGSIVGVPELYGASILRDNIDPEDRCNMHHRNIDNTAFRLWRLSQHVPPKFQPCCHIYTV
jgi:hypothetical protein